jgi:aminopeptidase 2
MRHTKPPFPDRVSYSPERLAKLGDEAGKGSKGAFSLNDRIGLVQDAFVLARSGYSRTSGSLNLVSKLKDEEQNLVWKEIATGLADLKDAWWEQPDNIRTALDQLARETFAPLATKLGWEVKESDSSDIREMRATALSVLAGSGDAE